MSLFWESVSDDLLLNVKIITLPYVIKSHFSDLVNLNDCLQKLLLNNQIISLLCVIISLFSDLVHLNYWLQKL